MDVACYGCTGTIYTHTHAIAQRALYTPYIASIYKLILVSLIVYCTPLKNPYVVMIGGRGWIER